MKLTSYLLDHMIHMIIYMFNSIVIVLMLLAFKVYMSLVLAIALLLIFQLFIILGYEYLRKYKFYHDFINYTSLLDKKYLVIEMLNRPAFLEGKIIYDNFYEINKSMNENVKEYLNHINEFKEYIEMWIHEVKIPISVLTLLNHNYDLDKKYHKQIRRLDNYIDQILYYVRSENLENDCIIKNISINKIINDVLMKNKDNILENHIDLIVDIHDELVLTDSKWLSFIINQIINNSIKYKREHSYIKISTLDNTDYTQLMIYDNGIGIPSSDLPLVFHKSYTGINGRKYSKSTGMGLYIADKLCIKLGHKISIESVEGEYTMVSIMIYKNHYINEILGNIRNATE